MRHLLGILAFFISLSGSVQAVEESEWDGSGSQELPTMTPYRQLPSPYEPSLGRDRAWPALPHAFDLGILLGQNDFHALSRFSWYLHKYVRASTGWVFDSAEQGRQQRFFHGPLGFLEARLINQSRLTPFVQGGPAFLFFKHRDKDLDQDSSAQSLALIGQAGLEIVLTDAFSLVMLQAWNVFETPQPEGAEESTSVATRTQMMFQFSL